MRNQTSRTHHIVHEGIEIGTLADDSNYWTLYLPNGRFIPNLPTYDEALKVLALVALRNPR